MGARGPYTSSMALHGTPGALEGAIDRREALRRARELFDAPGSSCGARRSPEELQGASGSFRELRGAPGSSGELFLL